VELFALIFRQMLRQQQHQRGSWMEHASHLGADAWKNRLDCGLGLPPGWNPGAQHCLPPAAVEYLVGQTLAFYI
jgi:hypothetical protein